MRLARVGTRDGRVWLGRIEGDEALLVSAESTHPAADALREALSTGVDLAGEGFGERVALDSVRLLSPVTRPSKVLAVGLNYADHARETGMAPPPAPLLFAKAPSSIIGPGDAIEWQASATDQVDYETELAVVMGTGGQVLGYTVCNDVSARDMQFGDGQWMRAKSLDTFCPLGPVIVTADDPAVRDVQSLAIGCSVNGSTLQSSTTAEMIFPVTAIVTYASRFMTLHPGDVIATGTPAGVGIGRTPPVFLADGDEVVCWVEGIGELRNVVRVVT